MLANIRRALHFSLWFLGAIAAGACLGALGYHIQAGITALVRWLFV